MSTSDTQRQEDPPFFRFDTVMVLGGGGLVGRQVVAGLLKQQLAAQIVVVSLTGDENEQAKAYLNDHVPNAEQRVTYESGNIFVPEKYASWSQQELKTSRQARVDLIEACYGSINQNWQENYLAVLINRHSPSVIIDAVNTATALSYVDVWDGTAKVRQSCPVGDDCEKDEHICGNDTLSDLECLLMGNPVAQMVRHVLVLQRAMEGAGTSQYIKIGTSGTGGMGLNIPYTHSEDKPSQVLLSKTAMAGAQQHLLWLLNRTPGLTAKEIKPVALIGVKGVAFEQTPPYKGKDFVTWQPQSQRLENGQKLNVKADAETYEQDDSFVITEVNTGENGGFTVGEFEAITACCQMEMVTAEEVADMVVYELCGHATGRDTIAALSSAALTSSYRGGRVAADILRAAQKIEQENGDFSVALGKLGPPQLSKLLYEATIFLEAFECPPEDIEGVEEVGKIVNDFLETERGERLMARAASIGVPVLFKNGVLYRGPNINIPPVNGKEAHFDITPKNVDVWAQKGWVDLREENIKLWVQRFTQIMTEFKSQNGSGSDSYDGIFGDELTAGAIVAWIFIHERGEGRIIS